MTSRFPGRALLALFFALTILAAGCGGTSAERDSSPVSRAAPTSDSADGTATQRVSIGFGPTGYDPATVRAAAGQPLELSIAQGEGCAAGFIMPDLGLFADNTQGPATLKLGRLEPGSYAFTCGMRMLRGTLIVTP